ncbi:MAG: hypothetical protein AB8C02_05315 [Halioglobus sp.]
MKTFFASLAGFIIVAGGLGYLFKDSLWETAQQAITKDMFIAADADTFDPGLAIGAIFPPIRAIHQGEQISSIENFSGDKGLLFIANRSASW